MTITPTARQKRILEEIASHGFVIKEDETKMIGKMVWIVAERKYRTEQHPDGCFMLDESLYGTIGPKGKLELSISAVCNNRKLTKPYQLRSLLDEWNWRFPKFSNPNSRSTS